jgi:hypothetical protein
MLLKYSVLTGFKSNAGRFKIFKKLGNSPSGTGLYTHVADISWEGRN